MALPRGSLFALLYKLATRYALKWLRANLGKKEFFPLFKQLQNLANEGLGYGNDDLIQQAEVNLIHRVAPNLLKHPIVFDIGANKGDYLKHWLNYEAKIHAFEPGTDNFTYLETHFGDKINAVNKAVGDQEGTQQFFIVKKDSRLNSLLPRTHPNHQWENGDSVSCITLDLYCERQGIEHINFLKIDVEGFELAVLKGASKMLASIDYIQFEFGGAHIEAGVYFRDFYSLLKPQFKLYHVLMDGIEEITAYDEKLENFKGTNYLAVR